MAKISVSLDDDLATALRQEAAGNVSQFVARAVHEALARAQMIRGLDELDDEFGPVDPLIQDEIEELFAAVVAETGRSRPGRGVVKAGKTKSASSSR